MPVFVPFLTGAVNQLQLCVNSRLRVSTVRSDLRRISHLTHKALAYLVRSCSRSVVDPQWLKRETMTATQLQRQSLTQPRTCFWDTPPRNPPTTASASSVDHRRGSTFPSHPAQHMPNAKCVKTSCHSCSNYTQTYQNAFQATNGGSMFSHARTKHAGANKAPFVYCDRRRSILQL